jgi:hypothetical protein
MNRIVKKMLLVAFLASSLPLLGQTFGEADLERLIMNHPMMKNYDAKTGHFRNTPYELREVSELKAENASMTEEVERIKIEELNNSLNVISSEDEDEEAIWSRISSLSKKKQELENKILKNKELIDSGGDPGYSKLYPIIDNMCNDIFISLFDKDKVILNKLPRYFSKKPYLEGKDFHFFWFNPNEDTLFFYLQHASFISLIFPSVDKTILFQKPSGDSK